MPTLSYQVRGLDRVKGKLDDLDKAIPGAVKMIQTAMERARRAVSKAAPRPRYPIQWDSEKQRRAFFATKGFGGGIPSRRSGKYEGSWKVRRNPSSDRKREGFSLYSNVTYAKYVGGDAYGNRQSNIHRGRWAELRGVVERETKNLPRQCQQYIDMVARRP